MPRSTPNSNTNCDGWVLSTAKPNQVLPTTPHALAQRLAHIARQLKQAINTALDSEQPNDPWYQQLKAFRQTLLPKLTPAEFADMYAQTIIYNLFATRVIPLYTPVPPLTRVDFSVSLPEGTRATPFALSRIGFSVSLPEGTRATPIHPSGRAMSDSPPCTGGLGGEQDTNDTHITSLIDECTALLEHTNIDEVLRTFGQATMQHEPVLHFYETFLAAYDPKTRNMRGVYYTPEPVVSYIVRSVDHLLQTCFGKARGLADENTIILDPATGTATFLHAVVQHIHATIATLCLADTWNTYVPKTLLPRLVGFELLMAPYTIANLKLSMLLQNLGYTFDSNEHLSIYLTNALADNTVVELPRRQAHQEHEENNLMVVLGNPPYSYKSANTSEWISTLVRDYYQAEGLPLGERNPKGLQDDYVKFIRLGQWHINHTGAGILAFINNNGYLDNPTFRGMRQSLLREFDTIYILNLHGNSRKQERAPDGSPDENVFDIQQGVAIGIFIKHHTTQNEGYATVHYADLWGKRDSKYAILATQDIQHTHWQTITPTTPWYLFVPQNIKVRDEYEQGWKITDIMPIHSVGIVTARDHLAVQWNAHDMFTVINDFAHLPQEQARTKYALGADVRDWKVAQAQHDIQQCGIDHTHISPILYRPFDQRYTYYTGKDCGFLCRPRHAVMQHMLAGSNIGLVTIRRSRHQSSWKYSFVSTMLITGATTITSLDTNYLYPLYLSASDVDNPIVLEKYQHNRRPNFAPAFIADVEQRLGLAFIPNGTGNLSTTIGPEDIFHYIYAILHSPSYRSRYNELLKIDFPRISITNNKHILTALIAHGAALVDLHLLRLPGSSGVGGTGGAAILNNPSEQGITQQSVTAAPIAHIRYDEQHAQVCIAKHAFFTGIEPETWTMHIGGYQPLHKWLKDRKGRTLSFDDALHYMRMVIALRETRRIMAEIDTVMRRCSTYRCQH